MLLKSISRVLCVSLALSSAAAFAEEIFRVDILHVVNGVEKPMSLFVAEGTEGIISLQSTEDAYSFDAAVQIDAEAAEGFYSINTSITSTNNEGIPSHHERKSRLAIAETPVNVTNFNVRTTRSEELLTVMVAKVDASAIPSHVEPR